MVSSEQIEELRQFCREVMAVDATQVSDVAKYVVVKAGRKFTRSEQLFDRVEISPSGELVVCGSIVGSTAEELEAWLLQQIYGLSEEHPRFYIAAYGGPNRKNPMRRPVRLDTGEDGTLDPELSPQPIPHDWSDGPNALIGAVGGMVERTNLLLARQLENALNKCMSSMDEIGELRAHLARLVTEREHFDENGAILAEASKAAAMQAAMERAAPILEQIAPIVAGGVGTWFAAQAALAHAQAAAAKGEEGPPEDATEATGYHIARLQAALAALGAHVQATNTITPEQVAQLEQMMAVAGAAAQMWKAQSAEDSSEAEPEAA